MASRWSFIFLLWYLCVLCVQPQNRFPVLYSLKIADICVITCISLHLIAVTQEGRKPMRLGPGTRAALILMVMSYLSLFIGPLQASSEWQSSSDMIMKNALLLILVEAMAYNVERVWMVMTTFALSTLWWVKAGVRLSSADATYSGDRIMGAAVGLVENPNAMAYFMCVVIPLYLYFALWARWRSIRWGSTLLVVVAIFIVLQTGSRTGLVTLIALGVMISPKLVFRQPVRAALLVLGLFLVVGMVAPNNLTRLLTVRDSIGQFLHGEVTEEKSQEDMTQDEQSAYERRMKNKHTWALIKRYPLGTGVASSDDLLPKDLYFAKGEVHSEILMAGRQFGFPGMALHLSLLAILFWSGGMAQRELQGMWPAAGQLGWVLRLQAVLLLVGGSFAPSVWNPVLLALAGCASALVANIKEGQIYAGGREAR